MEAVFPLTPMHDFFFHQSAKFFVGVHFGFCVANATPWEQVLTVARVKCVVFLPLDELELLVMSLHESIFFMASFPCRNGIAWRQFLRVRWNLEHSTFLSQPHFEVLLFLTLGQALGAVYDAPLRWPRG